MNIKWKFRIFRVLCLSSNKGEREIQTFNVNVSFAFQCKYMLCSALNCIAEYIPSLMFLLVSFTIEHNIRQIFRYIIFFKIWYSSTYIFLSCWHSRVDTLLYLDYLPCNLCVKQRTVILLRFDLIYFFFML